MTVNPSENLCTRCGAAISADTAGGLCPRCLMALNFESRTVPEDAGTGHCPLPFSPGELAGKFPQFEVLECLGRGGMGVVYKARQKALDRIVAIKVLAGEWHGDSGFAERFAREAKTLAQMNHPNIVTVHDFGESGGLFYLVMEYVDGVNLRDLLGEGRLTPEQALAIVPPICDGLQYAHEKGIVHRDIKPENLLLDRFGRVKIADFGIASLVGATGDRAGTPPYMAPEQSAAHGAESSVVDHRADIHALGVVLYEMLTGERPGKDVMAPSRKVQIDVRLDEMVLRALDKNPELRYQTADDFKTVLAMLTEVGGVKAADVSPAKADVSAVASVEEPDPSRVPGRWALFLLLLGVAFCFNGVGRMMISPMALILALVLGIRAWRSQWGKVAVIGAAWVIVPYAGWMVLSLMKMSWPPETEVNSPGNPAARTGVAGRAAQEPAANAAPGSNMEEAVSPPAMRPDTSPGDTLLTRVMFTLSHPAGSGPAEVRIPLSVGRGEDTGWEPAEPGFLTPPDGRKRLFRVRAAADKAGYLTAWISTSLEGNGDWKESALQVGNGLGGSISAPDGLRLQVSTDRPGGDYFMEELRGLASDRIIAMGLENPEQSFSAWNVLGERVNAGKLSPTDARALVAGSTAWLRLEYPGGYWETLPWLAPLWQDVFNHRLVTDQEVLDLLQAFYSKPLIHHLPRIRQGRAITLEIGMRNIWNDNLLNHVLFCNVRSVSVDGQEVVPRYGNDNSGECGSWEEFSCGLPVESLPPGRHLLKCEVDSALIPLEATKALRNHPGQKWPDGVRRWTRTAEAELLVYAEDEVIVALSDDPALDPTARVGLHDGQVIVRKNAAGRTTATVPLRLHMEGQQQNTVPFSLAVTLNAGGESYRCGSFYQDGKGVSQKRDATGSERSELVVEIAELPPEIMEADLVLSPDPGFIESRGHVKAIWGKDIVMKAVPLRRLDVSADADGKATADSKADRDRLNDESTLRKLPDARVIQVGLDDPEGHQSAWIVLKERVEAGKFGANEANDLMEKLTSWLRREHPQGTLKLPDFLWQLLDSLYNRGLVLDQKAIAFLQVFHGNGSVDPLPLARVGDPVKLRCEIGSPFRDVWFGLNVLTELRSITVDGQAVEIRGRKSWRISGATGNECKLELPSLPAGEHTLRCEIFRALVPQPDLPGLGEEATAADWPPAKQSWTTPFERELVVE